MANTEGPIGQPPAAWVWSQYRGELPAEAPPRETPAAASLVEPASPIDPAPLVNPVAPAASKHTGMIGLGLAGAVIVIAGLTWLFTSRPASAPAESPAPAATEAAPQKSEAAPPAVEPAAVVAPTPAAQEAPKAADPAPAPAAAPEHPKKKKHKS
ncbi:hypothetical protein OGR47_00190 [Methylocystis sp. MJC1]|jgi:hypothetical protein|uniref:hypothetical protein n=1 Tax=Methylocystis sp. MJC1 TaxID=2654282 RepID=UPI0013EB883E|nr:hypothetical protein [Methylocystis sp. MJC1]KAF2991948.1 hypothetical protein MJC1_00970 [Methylocystis sp. MJC1]MBU6525438.1 hypothetical protein [Methylocystis sp. MJC1]UZX11929.1 hypothetical protein OGR47_00190 [Methylocystis sp. MJC1]